MLFPWQFGLFQYLISTCNFFLFCSFWLHWGLWSPHITMLYSLKQGLSDAYTMSMVFSYQLLLYSIQRSAMDTGAPVWLGEHWAMSLLAILNALKCHFMGPHSQYWVLTTRFIYVCWCKSCHLRTLKPTYYNAILSETRAIRCIYYVYGIFLSVVTSDITITYLSMLCWVTNIMWGVGMNFQIGQFKMVFHLAPHKNNTFVPQGS